MLEENSVSASSRQPLELGTDDDLIFSVIHREKHYQPFRFDLRLGLTQYTREWLSVLRLCIEYEVTRKQSLATFTNIKRACDLLLTISFKTEKVSMLSKTDLLALGAASNRLKQLNLRAFMLRAFDRPELGRKLFDHEVHKKSLEVLKQEQDSVRSMIRTIVTRALAPSVYANVWAQIEIALADKKIENRHYTYFAVQASLNARDANLYPCKVSDLVSLNTKLSDGTEQSTWYLRIYLAKSRLDKAQDIGSLQPLPKEVGDRLNIHRKEVITRLGPYFKGQVDQIALFPVFFWADVEEGKAFRKPHNTEEHKLQWLATKGRGPFPHNMANAYLTRIKKIVGSEKVGTSTVRHTIGTHLAGLGYDARTIARILQHTDNQSSHFYVDILFAGLLENFGQAFEQQAAPIIGALIARIDTLIGTNDGSYDPSQLVEARIGNSVVATGACKTKRCKGVPYQCYLCPSKSFIPFVDGHHQALLDDLVEYRDEELPHMSSSFQLEGDNINALIIRIEAVIQACEIHKLNKNGGKDN